MFVRAQNGIDAQLVAILVEKFRGCFRCQVKEADWVVCAYQDRVSEQFGKTGHVGIGDLVLLCSECAEKSTVGENVKEFNFGKMVEGMDLVLDGLGISKEDNHVKETAFRAAKALTEILAGMNEPQQPISVFDTEFDEMVIVRGVEFVSMCAHHMLPFYGEASVGYLPNKKIIGLSKIPRIVEHFAKRLQVQEELTKQIAEYLADKIKPRGVGVVITAKHDCVACRGIKSKRAEMITSVMLGEFRESPSLKAEFMRLLSGSERG